MAAHVFDDFAERVSCLAQDANGYLYAANKYGNRKDKNYNDIISAKNLDLHYKSVTFVTFGSFGSGTWSIITQACDPLTHPKAINRRLQPVERARP